MTKLKKIAILFEDGGKLKIVDNHVQTKKLVESLNIKGTNIKNAESIVLEGICIDFKNGWSANDRFYNKKSYLEEFNRIAKMAEEGRLFAAADHPDEEADFISKTKEIAAIINKLWYDEENDCCHIRMTIIPTIIGGGYDLIIALQNGATLCVSSRAIGYLNESTKEAYLDTLYTYDIVSNGGMEVSTLYIKDYKTGKNLTESTKIVKKEDMLTEEAVSEAQQKLFGQALAVRRGEISKNDVTDSVMNVVDSNMTDKDIEDFASTSYDNLSEKLTEFTPPSSIKTLESTLNDMGVEYNIIETDDFVTISPTNKTTNEVYADLKKNKNYKNISISGKDIKINFPKHISLYENVLSYAKDNKINNKKLTEMINIQDYIGNETIKIGESEVQLTEKPYKNNGAWFSKIDKDGIKIEVMYNENSDSWEEVEDDEDPLVEMFESLTRKSLKNKNLVVLKECRNAKKKYLSRLTEAEAIDDISKREEELKLIEEEAMDNIEKIYSMPLTETFNDTAINVQQPKDDVKKFKKFEELLKELFKNYKNGKDFTIAADNSLWIQKEIINKGLHDIIKLTESSSDDDNDVIDALKSLYPNTKKALESIKKNKKSVIEEIFVEIGGSIPKETIVGMLDDYQQLNESKQFKKIKSLRKLVESKNISKIKKLVESNETDGIEELTQEIEMIPELETSESVVDGYNVVASNDDTMLVENEETGDVYVAKLEKEELTEAATDFTSKLPQDIIKWADNEIKNGKKAGVIDRISTTFGKNLGMITDDGEIADGSQKDYENLISWVFNNYNKKLTESKSAQKLAKELDFSTQEEYFDYIEDSLINGQRQQMSDLYKEMDIKSKEDFIKYAKDNKFKSIGVLGEMRLTENEKPHKLHHVTYYELPNGKWEVPSDSTKGVKYAIFDDEQSARDYIDENNERLLKKLTESKKMKIKSIRKLVESVSKSVSKKSRAIKLFENEEVEKLEPFSDEVELKDEMVLSENDDIINIDGIEDNNSEFNKISETGDEESKSILIENEETGDIYMIDMETEKPQELTEGLRGEYQAKAKAKGYDGMVGIYVGEVLDTLSKTKIDNNKTIDQKFDTIWSILMIPDRYKDEVKKFMKEENLLETEKPQELTEAKYSLMQVDGEPKDGKYSGTWVQDHIGDIKSALKAARDTEKANGGRIKIIVTDQIAGSTPNYGRKEGLVSLTESSKKRVVKRVIKLTESAKGKKIVKFLESETIDTLPTELVTDKITEQEIEDVEKYIDDEDNLTSPIVELPENEEITDENLKLVQNEETGDTYIVETEEVAEQEKTIDDEVAELKEKNALLESELVRISKFCEDASKHIYRLEENASLSNKHIRRLEESIDSSARAKTLKILLENKNLEILIEQSDMVIEKYPQLEMLKENTDSLLKFDKLDDSQKNEILEAISMLNEEELIDTINDYSSEMQ